MPKGSPELTDARKEEIFVALGVDPIEDDTFPLPAWSAEAHLEHDIGDSSQ